MTPPAAPEASSETSKQRVYRSLRADILSGVFDMGEGLHEGQLATKYGVSKTPVREALSLLRQEGLVEVLPRIGYLTSRVTLQDVDDIFDLRLTVESASAEKAALAITGEALQQLEHLCSRYQPGDRESYRLFLLENLDFHRTIAEASGNRRLVDVVTRLLEQMQRLLTLRLDPSSDGDDMVEEHLQILAALRERNPAQARELMIRSLVGAHQAVRQSLIKRMANWHI